MKRPILSAAILARDEEHHIGECLESVAPIADEIVVVLDDRSRDRTAEVCRAHGASLHRLAFHNYAAQRNHALARCHGEWVLFIDADERATSELRETLHRLKQRPWAAHPAACDGADDDVVVDGYAIPRHNLFFGHVVRGGGWYPDHQLRLLRRAHARYDERQLVHEVALLDGKSAPLEGHLLHINIEHMAEFWRKQASYALAEARILHQEGRHARARNFVGAPAREFWRRYVRLGGWRDGLLGLFLCLALAWFEVVKYGCLLLIQRSSTPYSCVSRILLRRKGITMNHECRPPAHCLLHNLDTVIASKTNQAPLTNRQQRAAERITEDEGLTGSLTDDQARPIIEWASYQASLLAADPARSDEEVDTLVSAIRRAVLMVGTIATAEHEPDYLLEQVHKELEQCI